MENRSSVSAALSGEDTDILRASPFPRQRLLVYKGHAKGHSSLHRPEQFFAALLCAKRPTLDLDSKLSQGGQGMQAASKGNKGSEFRRTC